MVKLEKELEESETQCKEKELQLVCQKKKEKELIVAVQRYGNIVDHLLDVAAYKVFPSSGMLTQF